MRNTKAIAMIVLMIASIGAGCTGTDGTNSDNNGDTCVNNL